LTTVDGRYGQGLGALEKTDTPGGTITFDAI
jgi:hypothetical protein